MPQTHLLQPGNKIQLKESTTDGKDFCKDRDTAESEFLELREELAHLQNRLYAERQQKLLVLFQAMDAGGKDGTIRHVFKGVNPQGVRVASFKAPSSLERSYDYLWRIHQQVPAKGMINIFNRSHYEDVLIVRVDHLVPEAEWRPRYEQINNFEKMLCATGTTILKFYLHISKEEQKERFQDRLDKEYKQWKFAKHDLEKRKQWDEYQAAYQDVLRKCTTEHAPWYVIPADRKWYRNLAISRVLVDTLQRMDPQFPSPEVGLGDIKID